MAFDLPELPFEKQALSPWTSAETIDFHYGKHHAGYVKKLNAAVEGTEWENANIIDVIVANRENPAIFNNAAQHWNHSYFWSCLTEKSNGPEGTPLAEIIVRDFGSIEAFKQQFGEKALTLFGSGWAWLTQDAAGKLTIGQYKDADSPVAHAEIRPVLTLDVWEHAYYIDYRNDRQAFIDGFWNHVDWEFAGKHVRV